MRHSRKALTLPELLLAIVVAGLTVGMVLRMVGQIRTTSSLIGDRSRRDGWQSFVDQIAQGGIDPSQAPLFREYGGSPTQGQTREGGVSVALVAHSMPGFVRTTQADSTGRVGEVGLTRLVIQHEDVVESRSVGFGFMLGQGAAVPVRVNPVLPLPPMALSRPTISPASGARLTLANVVPQAGAPSTVVLQATVAATDPGMRATVEVVTPVALSVSAVGAANTSVSLVHLASGLTARAWVEYPGGPGDTAILMPDGIRRTWRVRIGNRVQDYVPSDLVTYDFRVAIGSPVLSQLDTEYASSTPVPTDWYDHLAIQSGAPMVATGDPASSAIDWPGDTKTHFGGNWPLSGVFFTVRFNGRNEANSGSLRDSFSLANLGRWQLSFPVTARATLPGWLISSGNSGAEPTYSWTMQLVPVTLIAPSSTTTPSMVLGTRNTFLFTGGSALLSWGVPNDTPTGKPYVLSSARLGNAAASTTAGATWTVSTGPDVSLTVVAKP